MRQSAWLPCGIFMVGKRKFFVYYQRGNPTDFEVIDMKTRQAFYVQATSASRAANKIYNRNIKKGSYWM